MTIDSQNPEWVRLEGTSEVLPHIEPEPPVLQFVPVASCLVAGHN